MTAEKPTVPPFANRPASLTEYCSQLGPTDLHELLSALVEECVIHRPKRTDPEVARAWILLGAELARAGTRVEHVLEAVEHVASRGVPDIVERPRANPPQKGKAPDQRAGVRSSCDVHRWSADGIQLCPYCACMTPSAAPAPEQQLSVADPGTSNVPETMVGQTANPTFTTPGAAESCFSRGCTTPPKFRLYPPPAGKAPTKLSCEEHAVAARAALAQLDGVDGMSMYAEELA